VRRLSCGCAKDVEQGFLRLLQDAPHGIIAKVADFGLSREMACRSRIETRTCGTITHMPPELLSSDVVSKVPPCPPRPDACQDSW
jgi:serine/threonine protein kinase